MEKRHQEIYTQIGLNILYYRRQHGWTQQQLAEISSYSKNHIQRIETAVTTPSVEFLLDIADALEIPVEKLLETK